MAVLLARAADRLYWGARYVERAEDTARVVRAYHELVVDFPSQEMLRWEPLVTLMGTGQQQVSTGPDDPAGERAVVGLLLADLDNPCSIASSVAAGRENLRTTRETMPREAWQAVNHLHQYVGATASASVERRLRDHFLVRVIEISRRLDGIIESTMSRGHEHSMLRLGRLIERADMTTRVLGVAAAGILQLERSDGRAPINDEVRWMSVLRSVSALQMYQRSAHGPLDGRRVVRFLLSSASFPRSVQGCFDEIRAVLEDLPSPHLVLAALDDAEAVLATVSLDGDDAVALDRAMDRVQTAIAAVHDALHDRYVDSVLAL